MLGSRAILEVGRAELYMAMAVPHALNDTSLRVQSRPQLPQSEQVWHSGLSCLSVPGCQHRLQNQFAPDSFQGLASERQLEWRSA